MQNIQVNHKWISAKAYAEQTGISPEKAVQMIKNGVLEGTQTDKGYWKIKVYKDDAVPKKVFDEEHNKRIEAETMLIMMKKMLEGVKT